MLNLCCEFWGVLHYLSHLLPRVGKKHDDVQKKDLRKGCGSLFERLIRFVIGVAGSFVRACNS